MTALVSLSRLTYDDVLNGAEQKRLHKRVRKVTALALPPTEAGTSCLLSDACFEMLERGKAQTTEKPVRKSGNFLIRRYLKSDCTMLRLKMWFILRINTLLYTLNVFSNAYAFLIKTRSRNMDIQE